MRFELRPAHVQDLTQILDIYNHEILTGTANWNDQAKSLAQYQAWFLTLQQHNFPVWIAYDTEQHAVAGYGYYAEFRSITGFRQTVEHSIFISPNYQRQGLGKRLLRQLIELATQQKYHVMIGAIDSENLGSIALHEQLGFIKSGNLKQVGHKFGQWRDLVFMQRLLG